MNQLEVAFLKLVKFSAMCPDDKFENYSKEVQNSIDRFKKPLPLILPAVVASSSPSINSPRRNAQSPCYQRRGHVETKNQIFPPNSPSGFNVHRLLIAFAQTSPRCIYLPLMVTHSNLVVITK
eukprot:gene4351-5080_t